MGTTDPWKASATSETTSWDASFFSSSLPVLSRKNFNLNYRENVSSAFTDDLSCGNLNDGNDDLALSSGFLPDDENELLAGVMDDFDLSGLPVSLEDLDDDDIFDSSGGMELEPDQQEILSEEFLKMSMTDGAVKNSAVPQYAFSNGTGGTISGEHPFGEHPSRTLFVRNINSNVEDLELKSLFEQYGGIRNMYTACKHRGFVMISYYDIRDARNAMRALQNKPLRRRKLDIHFSIPKDNPSEKDINQGTLVIFNLDPSISNEELLKLFSTCGEVKEIRETPQKRHHKFIEYYDVRAAEIALKSLNGCEIAGKRIKLEPSRPGGARKTIMFQMNPELEQDDYSSFLHQMSSPIANSPPGKWMQFGSPIENRALQNLGQIPVFFKSNSPSSNSSHLPGLASILPSQVSNSLKIGMKQQYGGFPHAHSLPTQKLNEYHGSASSLGLSTSNGSVETLSGPQFLWGNPNPYMDSPGSSSNSHNLSLSGQFTSFIGKTSTSAHVVGSAPPGYPLHRQLDHFCESPEASFMGSAASFGGGSSVKVVNPRGVSQGNLFENNNNNNNFPILSPPRLNPVFLGGGMYPSFSPTGMEELNERIRSRRISEIESRKLFHIDLDKILIGEDSRTTLMIKNIPNKYTSKMLLASIDENHKGTYDFLYLPIDFKNKCNVGYAFINMLSPSHIIPFYEEFNGKRWEKFNSEKVAYLAYARIQGKAALISHFQNSSLMNEDKQCRPILFYSDGSGPIHQTEHHPTIGGSESAFSYSPVL